ncbi:MAG: hypothetical protein M9950_04755 [Thermomicrobiales bacterium]|nr:hypothetical protein [Thermomicrobiales bacterium]
MLSVEGTPMGDGTWMLIVPAGVYWVDVDDAGWYVEYSPQMEVFSGSESYLHITGFCTVSVPVSQPKDAQSRWFSL